MKLGFDLDGVISDTVAKAIEVFNDKFSKNLTLDSIKTFRLSDNKYDDDPEKNRKLSIEFINLINDPDIQLSSAPYKDALVALRKLCNNGHSIHIITARPKENFDTTVKWLRSNKISFDSLDIVDSEPKGMIGRSLNLDMYIDDFVDNLESMLIFKKRWYKGLLLLDRPWNQDIIDESKFKRIKNWNAVLRHIGILNR